MKTTLLTLTTIAIGAPALAEIKANFSEGAPKDQFTIRNTGTCALEHVNVLVDLSGSKAGLIFDVTERGAGVEVYQPFALVAGGEVITTAPEVSDGDSQLQLSLASLPPGEAIAFTIDVDDTNGGREITVDGFEITGAAVRIASETGSATGTFGPDATAVIPWNTCTS